jgi:Tol biopolymer transport system component
MRFRVFFVLEGVFLNILLGACEHNQNPISVAKPLEEQIVFATAKETPEHTLVSEIYLINDKGAGIRKLADGFEPRVSPDGRKVLFTGRMSNDQRSDIWAVELANGSLQNLIRTPTGRTDTDGQWSPDGSQIAYDSNTGPPTFDTSLWVMNADGSNQRHVTTDTTADSWAPRYSPDGKRLAFHWDYKGGGRPREIHTINIDGSDERRIAVNAQYPVWSPDGQMLAFYGYIINADGSGLRPLLPDEPNARVYLISWSPDGRRVVFGQLVDSQANVFTDNKDGSGKIQLTHFTTAGAFRAIAWSPTGKKIAFSYYHDALSYYNEALHIMNDDGSDLRKITDNIGVSEIQWVPPSK